MVRMLNYWPWAASVVILAYYFQPLMEICSNASTYVPFLNTSIYLILFNRLVKPNIFGPVENLYTAEELQKFDGISSELLYLSFLGNVFDVTNGKQFYGPGGTYHVFTAKDATRAFITGDFTEKGANDDVTDLPLDDILGLPKWLKIYQEKYEFKGKLIGRYYDSEGKPTECLTTIFNKISEAERNLQKQNEDKVLFPPCNVKWNLDTGTKIWCSKRSGGIDRDWAGVPRRLYVRGEKSFRCACVNFSLLEGKMDKYLMVYDGCDPTSEVCYLKG